MIHQFLIEKYLHIIYYKKNIKFTSGSVCWKYNQLLEMERIMEEEKWGKKNLWISDNWVLIWQFGDDPLSKLQNWFLN